MRSVIRQAANRCSWRHCFRSAEAEKQPEQREEPLRTPKSQVKRVLADSESSHASTQAALSADTNKLAVTSSETESTGINSLQTQRAGVRRWWVFLRAAFPLRADSPGSWNVRGCWRISPSACAPSSRGNTCPLRAPLARGAEQTKSLFPEEDNGHLRLCLNSLAGLH